ncbi:MAG: hypothetical protein L0H96_15245 [Humibacillus sp.]|nr:hypothetical protein [Humibacillus sp.]MDN5778257.1 hypothetical protein [Humibacillus sp.]
MTAKSDRQAAGQAMAAYHEAQLGELVARAGDGIDGFRTGQLDAFDVDRILCQYSRRRRSSGSSPPSQMPSSPRT